MLKNRCTSPCVTVFVPEQACIHTLEQARECCAQIGYPIMLKASWGGGGKGIRKASLVLCPQQSSCDNAESGHVLWQTGRQTHR